MKLELDDNSYWVCFWAIVCTAVVLLATIINSGYTERAKAAISAGYVENTVPGHDAVVWTKPKP